MSFAKKKITTETNLKILTLFLLAGFLFCGLRIFRDYGAASDEINQIEAGHITWNALCEHFGKEAPDFGNLPKLSEYYNRYYGQAATFPTVIIEALSGFSMDVSTVLRLRHLWNFFLYFCGMICLGILTEIRFHRSEVTFFTLLLHILTPRLFGDAFYNDRDAMLVSLLWIALLAFTLFQRRTNILSCLLCAFTFALAINTRFFALVLILLPLFSILSGKHGTRVMMLLLIGFTVIFWYGMTPLYWGNFMREFAAAFRTFSSGRQRTQETGGMASILFFGKYFRENALPFYYLPLWIFISTPLVPQITALFGLLRSLRKKKRDITESWTQLLLFPGIAAVMMIRPVLYNGWRHLYFFYVPVFLFISSGLNSLLSDGRKAVRMAVRCCLIFSAVLTGIAIARLHPYEYLYLNPLFSSRTADFDRDYWRLSTKESLLWITAREKEKVRVGEINENLDNSLIGLFPEQREKISVQHYSALHRYPSDYLIFNYSGMIGNEHSFPLYEPVHAVQRGETKLSEIYRRIPAITPSIARITAGTAEIADSDPETIWRSDGTQSPAISLTFEFTEPQMLRGLSLLPGEDEREYARAPEVCVSEDGEQWTVLPVTVSGLFDLSFPQTASKWLRIRNTDTADVHWSIREIYFY
ncbi:MAG: hypothetical protein IJI14_10685 [Anaerolineaceae bacterium]|nr:hypothetical protein [Anaerolineaceae bacterium]